MIHYIIRRIFIRIPFADGGEYFDVCVVLHRQ